MADQLDLPFSAQPIKNVRRGQQRLAGPQYEGGASMARRLALRCRIELVDKIRIAEKVAIGVVFGDVEVRRLHQRPDYLMDLPVKLLKVLRLAGELRDPEQRRLQSLDALHFGDVA